MAIRDAAASFAKAAHAHDQRRRERYILRRDRFICAVAQGMMAHSYYVSPSAIIAQADTLLAEADKSNNGEG